LQIWSECNNIVRQIKKYLIVAVLAALGSTVLLSSSVATSVLAQDEPYDEEYMQQHDGGDRDEYLQEMEHSDPLFYMPPVNDASFSATTNGSRPSN
jgi:hypothetical protein